MNTLTPNFSEEHQVQNFKAISKRAGVEVLEVNYDANLIDSKGEACYAGRTAYIKVGEKKALIYLALSAFVINNVIGKMFKNGYVFKK